MTNEVDNAAFESLMQERSTIILSVARKIINDGIGKNKLTRPLLSIIQAEATQLEELLDSFNAKNNTKWYPWRVHVAALKNFSTAAYEMLHLLHSSKNYEMHSMHCDFPVDTENALSYAASFIYCSLNHLLEQTRNLGWPSPEENLGYDFTEKLPDGRLPHDRQSRQIGSSQERIIKLATNYLNRTEDSRFLQQAAKVKSPKWKRINFEQFNEVTIRALEGKFHNLQSQYDTYVSDSVTESYDSSLPKLRGHISCVLHLLRALTIFIHFYERHFIANAEILFCNNMCALSHDWFFEILTHYLARYSFEFLESARELSQNMLKKYAVVETREVSIPQYFGFHVRPSSLISAIVHHYGSEVTMILDKEYDASVTLNLFLANEWVNQVKRQYCFQKLVLIDLSDLETDIQEGVTSTLDAVSEILQKLANDGVIRILTFPLPIDDIVARNHGSLREITEAVITYLHAQRQINIIYDIKVKFRGDVRVLNDISLLADNGYGENEHGGNIALPTELSYLSHTRHN